MPSDSPDYAALETLAKAEADIMPGLDGSATAHAVYSMALRNAAPQLITQAREADTLRAERDNLRGLLAEALTTVQRQADLARDMERENPNEPVADNGMTVWDAVLNVHNSIAEDSRDLRTRIEAALK